MPPDRCAHLVTPPRAVAALAWPRQVGKKFPAFKEPVEIHNFYQGKSVEIHGELQPSTAANTRTLVFRRAERPAFAPLARQSPT